MAGISGSTSDRVVVVTPNPRSFPVRKYSIGAALLDKNDPSKVLARSREPLLRPQASEREGYVPNVVYTCGAMRHNDQIILPYAVSDTFSNFATIKISALMQAMKS